VWLYAAESATIKKGGGTMAGVWIDLPPEVVRRLQLEAEKRGQEVEEYARLVLEASLTPPAEATTEPAWNGLPRRPPEELDVLTASQGVPLDLPVEELIGDFWPQDETADEFIAAVREWRRDGTEAPGSLE
jgi:hypothetical protein